MNESSLKERLKVVAKEKGLTFNETWKQLLLERFLARLSRSSYHEDFIFKGGLLLAQHIPIGRETTDIDLLMRRLKSTATAMQKAFEEMIATPMNDGFVFKWVGLEELTQPHMDYPGYRVSLGVRFGGMKDQIQVDIGVGDQVNPVVERFDLFLYRGKPIFEGEITLYVYPMEALFAEKLQTIVSKGVLNSRMKDYHDILIMIRQEGCLEVMKTKQALDSTFQHRSTALVSAIRFDAEGLSTLQSLWAKHLAGLGKFPEVLKLPEEISAVIQEINEWLAKLATRLLKTCL